uniref:NADP-dependent oxidoreductase domain-containing protein n=1 Tax=Timspurckia oligopyrenoides TaxID=708627 RepID=A0A6T6LED5_9RHOD
MEYMAFIGGIHVIVSSYKYNSSNSTIYCNCNKLTKYFSIHKKRTSPSVITACFENKTTVASPPGLSLRLGASNLFVGELAVILENNPSALYHGIDPNIIKILREGGVSLLDCSNLSEEAQNECFDKLKPYNSPVLQSTRILPPTPSQFERVLSKTLNSLQKSLSLSPQTYNNTNQLLYLIDCTTESYKDELSDVIRAFHENSIDAVGCYHCDNIDRLREIHEVLSKENVPLSSNQIPFSVIRGHDKNIQEIQKVCRELQVSPIAESPLENGMFLSEKNSFMLTPRPLNTEEYKPLVNLMRLLGVFQGGRSVEQVALNYVICSGWIPLAPVNSVFSAQNAVNSMGWKLDSASLDALDEKSKYIASKMDS